MRLMEIPKLSFFLLILQVWVGQQETQAVTLSPVKIPETGAGGSCMTPQMRSAIILNISVWVKNIMAELHNNCGSGLWHRVAYLNMSDSTQQCPSDWREDNINGIRFCRRPQTSSGSCPGTFYTIGRQYSKVCGRINGYQIGTTDAFGYLALNQTIDSYYVYGVSVTHSIPRNHIWTFAAGYSEAWNLYNMYNCPCSNASDPNNNVPPLFVGNNYYCESGNPTNTFAFSHIYGNDLLWDGQQCEGQCCSNRKSPPWFTVQLQNPTSDDIEVRICIPQASKDDIAVRLVEIYVY